MPFVKLKETELFYTDSETGNPLIFIHGLGGTHYMFEPQVQEFEKKYRVICPDIRGNGKSRKLTGNINTILDRQCDDMAELMDNIQIYGVCTCQAHYWHL